jgi:hypothetical protein
MAAGVIVYYTGREDTSRPWSVGSGFRDEEVTWYVTRRGKSHVLLEEEDSGETRRVALADMPPWNPPRRPEKKPAEPQRVLGGYAAKWRIWNDFYSHSVKEVKRDRQGAANMLAVWGFLWGGTGRNGLVCVSQRQIADKLGVRAATVNATIKRLQDLGLVQVVRQGAYRKGSSVYKVNGLIRAGHKQAGKRT